MKETDLQYNVKDNVACFVMDNSDGLGERWRLIRRKTREYAIMKFGDRKIWSNI